MADNPFAGTWSLVSSEMRTDAGEVFYPLGDECKGRIFFDDSGHLSAQLMRLDRPMFESNDLLQGTAEEIVEAYKGFVSFWGNYSFDPEVKELRYTIEGSLFPNWVGQENLRFYDFEENRVTYRTPQFPMGGHQTEGVLTWERIG